MKPEVYIYTHTKEEWRTYFRNIIVNNDEDEEFCKFGNVLLLIDDYELSLGMRDQLIDMLNRDNLSTDKSGFFSASHRFLFDKDNTKLFVSNCL